MVTASGLSGTSEPPPVPTNVQVQLAVVGVQITWQEPAGKIPDHYNIYRNGVQLEEYRYYATWHDRSFSKTEDGGDTWTMWYPPTPGEANHP